MKLLTAMKDSDAPPDRNPKHTFFSFNQKFMSITRRSGILENDDCRDVSASLR